MATIAFHKVITRNHECYACNKSDESPFVAHQDHKGNDTHHLHHSCLKAWVRAGASANHQKCPMCKQPFDGRSIFPFADDLTWALKISSLVGIGASALSWGNQKLLQHLAKELFALTSTPAISHPAIGCLYAIACTAALLFITRVPSLHTPANE